MCIGGCDDRGRKEHRKEKLYKRWDKYSKELFKNLAVQRMKAIIKLLKAYFVNGGGDLDFVTYKFIRLPNFTYVSSCRALTLSA